MNTNKDDGGYVYVVEAVSTGYVKIGTTKSPDPCNRVRELQTGCPFKLRLIACFYVQSPLSVERELHGKIRQDEWALSPADNEFFRMDHPVIRDLLEAPFMALKEVIPF